MVDVTPELARLAHDWFHRMENTLEASDSWYDTSCRGLLEYHLCPGDHLLNWKDKGYVTVFDLLQVSHHFVLSKVFVNQFHSFYRFVHRTKLEQTIKE